MARRGPVTKMWAGFTPGGRMVCAFPTRRRCREEMVLEYGTSYYTEWKDLKRQGFTVEKLAVWRNVENTANHAPYICHTWEFPATTEVSP